MYVRFDFSQEDLVDASKRLLNHRKPGRSNAWKNWWYSATAVAVVIFFFTRSKPAIGLLLGLVAGLIMLIYPQLEKRGIDARLRQIVAELMQDPGPHVCEVEIRSEGVWVRQMNKQIIHEWQGVEAVEETSDSVDIFTLDGGGVVVRNRAFASAGERSKFIEIARSRLMESRG